MAVTLTKATNYSSKKKDNDSSKSTSSSSGSSSSGSSSALKSSYTPVRITSGGSGTLSATNVKGTGSGSSSETVYTPVWSSSGGSSVSGVNGSRIGSSSSGTSVSGSLGGQYYNNINASGVLGSGISLDPNRPIISSSEQASTTIGDGSPSQVSGYGLWNMGLGYPEKVMIQNGVIGYNDNGVFRATTAPEGGTVTVNGVAYGINRDGSLYAIGADASQKAASYTMGLYNEYQKNAAALGSGGYSGNIFLDQIAYPDAFKAGQNGISPYQQWLESQGGIGNGSGVSGSNKISTGSLAGNLGISSLPVGGGADYLAALQDYSPPEYAGSQWDDVLNQLAQELLSMNYENWTQGDQYAALAKRYGSQGSMAMQDVLGQIASRTGGLASSYATTAANQQYNDYMAQLEEVARQMYDSERADKLQDAQMARQYSQDDYNRYLDELSQWNSDRSYNYNAYRDAVADQRYAQEYADSRADLAYNRDLQSQQQDLAIQQAIAQLLAGSGDYSGYQGLYGLSDDQVSGLSDYWNAQNDLQTALTQAQIDAKYKSSSGTSSSGSSSGNSGNLTGQDEEGLYAAAYASSNPKNFLSDSNNYKKYGFNTSTGLYEGYTKWKDSISSVNGQKVYSVEFNDLLNYAKTVYEKHNNDTSYLYDVLRNQGYGEAVIDEILTRMGL